MVHHAVGGEPFWRLDSLLEQFQRKWEPVSRPELRQNKEIKRVFDPIKNENASSLLHWYARAHALTSLNFIFFEPVRAVFQKQQITFWALSAARAR